VEALARDLLAPPGSAHANFSAPAGEAALVAADSVSWAVCKNPVTLFIGGITAVLMELAEPRVRHGVWEHSRFSADPLLRLQRTGLAAMLTVYGAASQARAMIEGVTRMHGRVAGETPAGEPYHALDPDLLNWVHATAAYGFVEAHAAYVRRPSPADRDFYWAESAPVGALFGACGSPRSEGDWQALLAGMRPRLAPSTILFEFLAIMRGVSALPRFAGPAQHLLVKAAVEILPAGLSAQLGLGPEWRLRGWERRLVRAVAAIDDRLVIRTWPSVQACRRLGLPDDYLYR
jgi:uncharacterized protein (DUF2236 family)